jgi:hypothetical protein
MVSLAPDALRALDAQPVVRSVTSPTGTPSVARSAVAQAAMAARTTEEVHVSSKRAAEVVAPAAPPPESRGTTMPPTTASSSQLTPDGCRYCGGALPEGRKIVFCPHCGHNLTVQHCPACNAELEVGWNFCITCGRGVS